MKKLLFVMLAVLCGSIAGTAQINRLDIDDNFHELDSEELTLRFFNALDGLPIPDARVAIDSIGAFVTDREGALHFPIPEEDGFYRVEFAHADYIRSVFQIEVMAGTLFFNRFSVSPALPVGSVRVVLDWSEEPADIDAHLIKQGHYHVAYHHKRVSEDGVARLDRDDRDGYGPETITIKQIDRNSDYLYFLQDYSNRNNRDSHRLSESRATVKVFGNRNELLQVIQVPQFQSGTYWPVFRISNGRIVLLNASLTNAAPEP